jgi:hypothetical protein
MEVHIMADVDSKQEYAPGVTLYCQCDDYDWYVGKATALVASGLVQRNWLPGEEGNGKTAQSLIFFEDGAAQLLKPKSHFKSFDRGFGGIQIRASGSLFNVIKRCSKAEAERRKTASNDEKEKQAWQLAKEAHSQPDLTVRWKNGVLYHIEQAERLIDGRLIFTDFPDIGIQPGDVESAKRVIAELRDVLRWANPKIKDKAQRSNVISLNDAAFRFMKRS